MKNVFLTLGPGYSLILVDTVESCAAYRQAFTGCLL